MATQKLLSWRQAKLAPIVLLKGKEELFASRALSRLRTQAKTTDPDVQITYLEVSGYRSGELLTLTSPSLFGEPRLVIVQNLESLNDDLRDDLLAYSKAPENDVWLIAHHGGGVKGKKLLDQWKKLGVPTVNCEPVKKDRDKLDLVVADIREAGLKIEPEAAQLLVDALGSDLAQLSAATGQLCSDFMAQYSNAENQGEIPAYFRDRTITFKLVEEYWGSRVEASAFKVCDAALAGNVGLALKTLRQAFNSGVDPVVIMATLAIRIRQLAWVSGGIVPGENLGMAPWQVQKAQREARGWNDRGLAVAIEAIAAGDQEVKGESKDPRFAAERAVRRVSQARQLR